ncbi:hypothetical protein DDB_G0294000 [Dictyostelium discoideum AX4]|uniref:Uncharacterized protein n=1 Tax=Dictyostelium discoideum TaxID=44689 RepID=Q54B04_DICDI|nr:hypothetical protein DDB_G0294000 [Dictyostelium discoideum AX4]EAL60442.1 hypothetical protein DDB_G0294000 [Dictyostelium discoideum AX4]|eukprot:XP_628855.1 hypothetical protein DDB_G0294000 [Dictyostelium discoideum AX4]
MEIDNNEFEISFWKVIHNKYLFDRIINYIQCLEWVNYDDYNQLHIEIE